MHEPSPRTRKPESYPPMKEMRPRAQHASHEVLLEGFPQAPSINMNGAPPPGLQAAHHQKGRVEGIVHDQIHPGYPS